MKLIRNVTIWNELPGVTRTFSSTNNVHYIILYHIILYYIISRTALLHGPSKVLQISTSKWAIGHSHLNNSWISLPIKEKHCYRRTHSACPSIETRLNYTKVSGARGHDLSRGLSNSCSSTLLQKVTQHLFILREPTREICVFKFREQWDSVHFTR